MTDATNDDVFQALRTGPQGAAKSVPAPSLPSGDASNADVLDALGSGPQGSASVANAPWYKHYPAMVGQTVGNAAIGLANLPSDIADFANRHVAPLMPKALTTPIAELPAYMRGEPTSTDTGAGPHVPELDLGEAAIPQGNGERLAMAGVGGGTVALLSGFLGALPAALRASGKEIMAEVSPLLKQAGILGVIPGVAAEGANEGFGLDKAPPAVRAAVETTAAITAALAAHQYMSTEPFKAVRTKLSTAETADEAGDVAKLATQAWRTALPAKIAALRDIRDVPLTPEGDVTGPAMFGKVPLHSATVDMTETMRTASELAGHGGVNAPFLHAFGSDMPPRAKAVLDAIAAKNSPIVEYPAKVEKPYSGPLRPDTSPIMEGDRGDLVGKPVAGLAKPSVGLLAGPTESPLPQPPAAAQTNPLQWQMKSPGVAGVAPEVEPSAVQLPSVVRRSSSPAETIDPEMRGSKQLGPVRPPAAAQPGPANTVAGMPGEASPSAPGFETPEGKIVGYKSPLADAMALRSYIGEMTSRGMMPKGSSAAQWDSLYRGLSADIGNTMELHGARDEWNNYNTKTTQLYTDGAKLSKFSNDNNVGKDTAEAGKAVSSLWSGMQKDSTDITTLREHLPAAADAVAAAFLKQSPEKWAVLAKKNPEAAKALVPNPFDRLALSSASGERSNLIDAYRENSTILKFGAAGGLMGNLLEAYNNTHTGTQLVSPFTAATTAMALPIVARGAGHILHNPRMLRVPATGALAASPLLEQQDKLQ